MHTMAPFRRLFLQAQLTWPQGQIGALALALHMDGKNLGNEDLANPACGSSNLAGPVRLFIQPLMQAVAQLLLAQPSHS